MCYKTVLFLLESRQFLSAQIKHYAGFNLFIRENSLRLPRDWIENQLCMIAKYTFDLNLKSFVRLYSKSKYR